MYIHSYTIGWQPWRLQVHGNNHSSAYRLSTFFYAAVFHPAAHCQAESKVQRPQTAAGGEITATGTSSTHETSTAAESLHADSCRYAVQSLNILEWSLNIMLDNV